MATKHLPIADPAANEQIVERAATGARLLTARGVGMRMVSILSNLALFALVTPAELGLLAVVRGITALAGNTSDLGFAWALIRREQPPERADYAALSGMQLALVVTVVGLVLIKPDLLSILGAVAPEWHWWMLAVLATTAVIPFGTGAKIRIERSLDYRRIAFYDVSSVLLLNLALLAFAATGHFSVGVFIVTGGIVLYNNLLLYAWSPGPGPSFRISGWRRLSRELAGFSAGHLFYILLSSATPVLVAKLFGLSAAGIWSFAVRLGNLLQVAFEGFRRAAVPAAPRLIRSPEVLRRLVSDSLLGAARLTIPLMAALYAALPAIGLFWPRWESAIRVGQFYALGFGLAGLISCSLVPAAVALRGPSVVLAEQGVPLTVGWLGLVLLWLLHQREISWVILPMYAAHMLAMWRLTDPAVRPAFSPELGHLALGLGLVIVLVEAGRVLAAPPLVVAMLAGAAFATVWLAVRLFTWTGAVANPRAGWE